MVTTKRSQTTAMEEQSAGRLVTGVIVEKLVARAKGKKGGDLKSMTEKFQEASLANSSHESRINGGNGICDEGLPFSASLATLSLD